MNFLRKLLFPFAVLYGLITGFRNFLFDKGILKSYSFDLPVIVVGNLSVGGTGKSPQIEYLIRLLSDKYKVATLSRGYKRQSEGFVLANESSNAKKLGDEPFQFYKKFKNILVAVDANRKKGIEQLLLQCPEPDVILLDDAFQHRKVKANFYILLTTFDELYCEDYILPTGNLRESRSGGKRANVVIVTKCPKNVTKETQNQVAKKLNLNSNQQLFFSFIDYDDFVYSEKKSILVTDIINEKKLIIAGIAKPDSFVNFLKSEKDEVMIFPDHHNFSETEILEIKKKSKESIIVTTEKDYVRLMVSDLQNQLFYLRIKSKFVSDQEQFDKTILDFVSNFKLSSK
jgi:tetraacyldisaccharide 4'-kinase